MNGLEELGVVMLHTGIPRGLRDIYCFGYMTLGLDVWMHGWMEACKYALLDRLVHIGAEPLPDSALALCFASVSALFSRNVVVETLKCSLFLQASAFTNLSPEADARYKLDCSLSPMLIITWLLAQDYRGNPTC